MTKLGALPPSTHTWRIGWLLTNNGGNRTLHTSDIHVHRLPVASRDATRHGDTATNIAKVNGSTVTRCITSGSLPGPFRLARRLATQDIRVYAFRFGRRGSGHEENKCLRIGESCFQLIGLSEWSGTVWIFLGLHNSAIWRMCPMSCSAHSWSMQHILGCKAGELRLHSKRRDHGRIGEVMGFVLVGGQRCSATKWSTC